VETAWIPLLWTAFHVSKLSSSYVFGAWSDRMPRWRLVAAGWGVYALAYLGFAAAERPWHAWAVFVFYGLFYGLVAPAQKAMVKDLSPAEVRGRAFGAYNFVVGIAALPAGLTYVICHPAADSPELRAIAPDWRARVRDYVVMTDPALRSAVVAQGIHLIGWRDIQRALRG
jgi:MFS family permease